MPSKNDSTITKNISSLLKTTTLNVAAVEDGQVVQLPLEALQASRYQTRKITTDRARSLMETIKLNGLLQPVVARPVTNNEYELIAGHRRLEAFRTLASEATADDERKRWATIPCILRHGLTEVQAAALTALENLERDDGDIIEQALSLLNVKKAGNLTTNEQVAAEMGLSKQKVTRLLQLAEAPAVIQSAVTPGVFVEVSDGAGGTKKEHRKIDPTTVLSVIKYHRNQDRAEGPKVAGERTSRLLARAAKGGWTRARLDAEIAKLTAGRPSEADPSDDDASQPEPGADFVTPPQRPTRRLYQDRGAMFVIYPKNLKGGQVEDLERLQERLSAFLTDVAAELSAVRNHQ